jgi:hypothetical protein
MRDDQAMLRAGREQAQSGDRILGAHGWSPGANIAPPRCSRNRDLIRNGGRGPPAAK